MKHEFLGSFLDKEPICLNRILIPNTDPDPGPIWIHIQSRSGSVTLFVGSWYLPQVVLFLVRSKVVVVFNDRLLDKLHPTHGGAVQIDQQGSAVHLENGLGFL